MKLLDRVLKLVRQHRPGLRLVDKASSPLMRSIAWPMRPFMPGFLSSVTTVIGDTVYLPGPPESLDEGWLARVLLHELVHQQDQAAHGWIFYATYAVFPSPFWRTGRAHWERRAYAVDLMLAFDEGGEERLARTLRFVEMQFSGPAYGWMWGGREAARAYLSPLVEEIKTGALQRRPPYDEIYRAWRDG